MMMMMMMIIIIIIIIIILTTKEWDDYAGVHVGATFLRIYVYTSSELCYHFSLEVKGYNKLEVGNTSLYWWLISLSVIVVVFASLIPISCNKIDPLVSLGITTLNLNLLWNGRHIILYWPSNGRYSSLIF